MHNSPTSVYQHLYDTLPHLLEGETHPISNSANFAAAIYDNLTEINWAGFYFLDSEDLVLGPFVGKPACTRIRLGKGVCGTSAQKRETIVVPDVHQFAGHIACDANSRSEMVVPLVKSGKLYGVFDIDSPVIDRFSSLDKEWIEKLVNEYAWITNLSILEKIYES